MEPECSLVLLYPSLWHQAPWPAISGGLSGIYGSTTPDLAGVTETGSVLLFHLRLPVKKLPTWFLLNDIMSWITTSAEKLCYQLEQGGFVGQKTALWEVGRTHFWDFSLLLYIYRCKRQLAFRFLKIFCLRSERLPQFRLPGLIFDLYLTSAGSFAPWEWLRSHVGR